MQNLAFGGYPAERLRIDSIHSRLLEDERLLRHALMDYIIDHCGPVSLEDVESDPKLRDMNCCDVARRLLEKQVIVQTPEGRINFVYPVSGLPTAHKVTLSDGRTLSAMCAIDAMGTAFTFEQDVAIESVCRQCNKPVHVRIKGGVLTEVDPPTVHALHVDLKKTENWAGSC